jgi:hypothetical protein
MRMKLVKIVLITLLSLASAALLTWCVMYYLVWPKPEILGLVPNAPLFFIAASNLDETLSASRTSEFVNRVARSPLWRDLKSSRLWRQLRLQKRIWERQMGLAIDPEDPDGVIQLVEKDAILAFYGGQRPLSFLLISQVGLTTRINIMSRSTKRMLASRHEFTTEQYRGIELMTVAQPSWKFSYGFIGRAGLLSTDKSLLKEAVDLYKVGRRGLTATPGFKKLVVDLPASDTSFYINVAKIRDVTQPLRTSLLRANGEMDSQLRHLMSVAGRIDALAGVGSHEHGNLMLDARWSMPSLYSPRRAEGTGVGESSIQNFVPTNCLFFMLYGTLRPGLIFEMLRAVVGSDLDVVRDRLLPVLHNGAAVAVLEPNIKELQLLPPVMFFFRVKDRTAAQTALEHLKGSLKIGHRQLEFVETKHEDIAINYTRLPIGMGMSMDVGYALIGDDLLVVATDTSALETAIDVALSKRQSLMDSGQYASVLAPIAEAADGRIFMNIRSTAAMTKQAARLYAWRAKLAGEYEAERIATMLYQNAFTLEAWHYMGATFNSDSDKTNVRMVLDSDG